MAGGVVNVSLDCSGSTSCDKNDTAVKVFGGYKLNENLGLELSYSNYGKARATFDFGGTAVDGEFKGSGVGVGVAAFVPVSQNLWGVFRFGALASKVKITASASGASGSDSDSGITAYGGFGLSYKLSSSLSLDAGVEFTNLKYEGEKASTSTGMIGATFSF